MIEEFGFAHSDVMGMPYRTFRGYQRLAVTRRVNRNLAYQQAKRAQAKGAR